MTRPAPQTNPRSPVALLLISSHCPHCPTMLDSLAAMIKQGLLSHLEIINLEQDPDAATSLGVRSVPWVRIGPFELLGMHNQQELERWAQRADADHGWQDYFEHLLASQRPQQVIDSLRSQPERLKDLIALAAAEDTAFTVRIGIGVVFETLEGDPILKQGVDVIAQLTQSSSVSIRADAAHFLSLTHDPDALPILKRMIEDDHPDVREIATTGIDEIKQQENT